MCSASRVPHRSIRSFRRAGQMGNSCHPATVAVVSLEDARAALARHDWLAAYASASATTRWLAMPADRRCLARRAGRRRVVAGPHGRLHRVARGGLRDLRRRRRRAPRGPVRGVALRALRVQGAAERSRAHGCAGLVSGSTTTSSASSTATSLVREVEVLHGRGELDEAIVHANSRARARAPAAQRRPRGRGTAGARTRPDRSRHRARRPRAARRGDAAPRSRDASVRTRRARCTAASSARASRSATTDVRRSGPRRPRDGPRAIPTRCSSRGCVVCTTRGRLQSRGDWTRAEQEVTRACAELSDMSPAHAAAGYVELGELRRRFGDLAARRERSVRPRRCRDVPNQGSRSSGWRRGSAPQPRRSSRRHSMRSRGTDSHARGCFPRACRSPSRAASSTPRTRR